MKPVICPLDGKPCEANCPDRFRDVPEGGCLLTAAQEAGAAIAPLDSDNAIILFMPKKEEPASAINAGELRGEQNLPPVPLNDTTD